MDIEPQVLEDYFRKSGDTELVEGHLETSDDGFCVWGSNSEGLCLIHVYGDGVYWNSWADKKAEELGVTNIFFATTRSPRGFERKFNYKVIGHILERKASWAVQ